MEDEKRVDIYEEYSKISTTFEDKLRQGAKTLWKYCSAIIAVGIAIWWIFYGTIEIVPTNLTIVDRVGLTFCTVMLAVTYCKLVSAGGFTSAKDTPEYQKAYNEWSTAVRAGNSKKHEIMIYAKETAIYNQKVCRMESLEELGMNYYDYFNENGEFIKPNYYKDKLLTRKQKRLIRKCLRIKVIVPKIFGDISGKFFGIKKEESRKGFETRHDIFNFVVRAVISTVSVGFMFNFIGFSIGSMMYALFQIVLWTGSGIAQRLQNYNFVINKEIPQLIEKTLIINGYLETHKEAEQNG